MSNRPQTVVPFPHLLTGLAFDNCYPIGSPEDTNCNQSMALARQKANTLDSLMTTTPKHGTVSSSVHRSSLMSHAVHLTLSHFDAEIVCRLEHAVIGSCKPYEAFSYV
jgi:hypothetical protein